MKKVLLAFALVMGFTSASQAGWMVEPYLGWERGDLSKDTDGTLSGTAIGARVAYTLPVLVWLGLDGMYTLTGEYDPDGGSKEDAKRTSLYAVVGVDFPILVRGWLGYGLLNEWKLDSSPSAKLKGDSMKIGVGFTGLPFVSVNFEYIKDSFDKYEMNGTTDVDVENTAYMISVSLPWEF